MKKITKIWHFFLPLTKFGKKNDFLVYISLLFFAGFSIYHLGDFTNDVEMAFFQAPISEYFRLPNHQDIGFLPAILASLPKLFIDFNSLSPEKLPLFLTLSKLPIVFFNTILLYLSYLSGKEAFGKKPAVTIIVASTLLPVSLGLGQFLHPSSITPFLLLALITTFVCATKNVSAKPQLFILSALFLLNSPILFPVLIILATIYLVRIICLKFNIFQKIITKFLCGFTTAACVFLLLVLFFVAANSFSGLKFFDLAYYLTHRLAEGTGTPIASLVSFLHLSLYTLPLHLVLAFPLSLFFIKKAVFTKAEYLFFLLCVFAIAIIFLQQSIEASIDLRNSYAAIILLAASASILLIKQFSQNYKPFIILLTIFGLSAVWIAKPFYLHYTDILNHAGINPLPNYGQGGKELADYVKTFHKDKVITSNNVNFLSFYDGSTQKDEESEKKYPVFRVYEDRILNKQILVKATGTKEKDTALKIIDTFKGKHASGKNWLSWATFYFTVILAVVVFSFKREIRKDNLNYLLLPGKIKNYLKNCKKPVYLEMMLLIIILGIFTSIKAPFFANNFTGEHAMKYNSYVEPAKYMAEQNNFLLYQKKYMADPVSNPQGIHGNFNHYPIIEWSLAALYKTFPQAPIEFLTRIFTHLIGILIIICFYLLLRQHFKRSESLLITSLAALNPIIIFGTFVTVEDQLLILFSILCLNYLSKYSITGKFSSLFLSGLFFGLGLTNKISIFLYLAPMVIIFLKKGRSWQLAIKDALAMCISALLPLSILKVSYFGGYNDAAKSASIILSMIILSAYLYCLANKYWPAIEAKVKKARLILFAPFLLLAGTASIAWIYSSRNSALISEFLTDKKLIFNFGFYKHIIVEQFSYYATIPVLLLAIAGVTLFYLGKLKDNKNEHFYKAFFTGSLVYLAFASKTIFIHNYYTMVIMITLCLFASIPITLIINKAVEKNRLFLSIAILLAFLIPFTSILNAQKLLSKQRAGFDAAATYLRENTSEKEMYIDGDFALSLTLKTTRSAVDLQYFKDDRIRQLVKDNGLKKAMELLNIRYYITSTMPDYYKVAEAFMEIGNKDLPYNRTELILKKLDQAYSEDDLDDKIDIINKKQLVDLFYLEYSIGEYNFYRFKEPNEPSPDPVIVN